MSTEGRRKVRTTDRTRLNIPPETAADLNLTHQDELAIVGDYPNTTDLVLTLPPNAPQNPTTTTVRRHNGEYTITIPTRILSLREHRLTEFEYSNVEDGAVTISFQLQ